MKPTFAKLTSMTITPVYARQNTAERNVFFVCVHEPISYNKELDGPKFINPYHVQSVYVVAYEGVGPIVCLAMANSTTLKVAESLEQVMLALEGDS